MCKNSSDLPIPMLVSGKRDKKSNPLNAAQVVWAQFKFESCMTIKFVVLRHLSSQWGNVCVKSCSDNGSVSTVGYIICFQKSILMVHSVVCDEKNTNKKSHLVQKMVRAKAITS